MRKNVNIIKKSLKGFIKLLKNLFKKKRVRRKYFSLAILKNLEPKLSFNYRPIPSQKGLLINFQTTKKNGCNHLACSYCKLMGRKDNGK